MKYACLAVATGLSALVAVSARADVVTAGSTLGTLQEVGNGFVETTTDNPAHVSRTLTSLDASVVPNGGGGLSFADGVAAAAYNSVFPGAAQLDSARATTTISQHVTNTGPDAMRVNFASTLFNGAFGLYVASFGECETVRCSPDLSQQTPLAPDVSAGAGFAIDVKVNGVTIYTLSAGLLYNSVGLTSDVGGAAAVLNDFAGFQLGTNPNLFQAFYRWSDTPFSLNLGNLGAGQSLDVTYDLTTYADNNANTSGDFLETVFSAFGDPTGGGHVINLAAIPFAFDIAAPAITFAPLTSVPEPGTWALFLVGFGLAGTALRRRRPVGA